MGVSHEETLLEETTSREEALMSTISDLESEMKTTKQSLEHAVHEKVSLAIFSYFFFSE